MTKKELQIDALRWARSIVHSEKYLYHLARNGSQEPTDKMVRMVIKSIFSVPGSYTDDVDEKLINVYDDFLNMNWMTFKKNTRQSSVYTAWRSPAINSKLHYINEEWKPKAFAASEDVYPLIPNHMSISHRDFEDIVLGG